MLGPDLTEKICGPKDWSLFPPMSLNWGEKNGMGVSASLKQPSHHHICLCALWSSVANLHSDPTQTPTSLILGLTYFAVNPSRAVITCLKLHFSSRWWGWRLDTGLILNCTGLHALPQMLVPNLSGFG